MSTTTTNLGLIKPELTDAADITAMNDNWDKIDEKFESMFERMGVYTGDMNELVLPGQYRLQSNVNLPSNAAYYGQCFVGRGVVEGGNNDTVVQIIVGYSSNKMFYRGALLSNGTWEWGDWSIVYSTNNKPQLSELEGVLTVEKGGTGASTLNGAVANLLCRNAIGNDTIVNANTLTKTGIYKIYLTDEYRAIQNNYPYVYGNMLVISNMEETSYTYVIQMFLTTNGIIYVRSSTNNGSTWTTWAMLYGTNTTIPAHHVTEGVLGGTVYANPNSIKDFITPQLRDISVGNVEPIVGQTYLASGSLFLVYE